MTSSATVKRLGFVSAQHTTTGHALNSRSHACDPQPILSCTLPPNSCILQIQGRDGTASPEPSLTEQVSNAVLRVYKRRRRSFGGHLRTRGSADRPNPSGDSVFTLSLLRQPRPPFSAPNPGSPSYAETHPAPQNLAEACKRLHNLLSETGGSFVR